jgi:hypothetical protein
MGYYQPSLQATWDILHGNQAPGVRFPYSHIHHTCSISRSYGISTLCSLCWEFPSIKFEHYPRNAGYKHHKFNDAQKNQ